MPATTSPSVVSKSSMIADSTLHTASRRCSGSASTSPSWSETSTRAIIARVNSPAAGVAVTLPSLIWWSSPVGRGNQWPFVVALRGVCTASSAGSLELDRAIGQRDTREDTRPAGYHVVRPHLHPLAEHRTTGYSRTRADPAARRNDAVAKLAALADLGPFEDDGPLH